MRIITRFGLAALAFAGLLSLPGSVFASKPATETPAQLIVEDSAKLFSPTTVEQAKGIVAGSMGIGNRQVHVETFDALTAAERQQFQAAEVKKTFWDEWAKARLKGDRGISILICADPRHIEVRVDKQMHDHGFSGEKEHALYTAMVNVLKEGGKDKPLEEIKPLLDKALIAAAEYVKNEIPKNINTSSSQGKNEQKKNEGGSKLGSYICIGLCVLLGVWLVVGLIRAFSTRGGGGAGGGGGGGFGTSLLGGLFGAMAGMWLYNSMFGGHDSSAFGGDSGGDYGGGDGDAGAGDYGGDAGSGGDWGGGGGDFGGGGGDW